MSKPSACCTINNTGHRAAQALRSYWLQQSPLLCSSQYKIPAGQARSHMLTPSRGPCQALLDKAQQAEITSEQLNV